MWHDLLADGGSCGLHRVECLIRAQGLRARPRRRGLSNDHGDRSVIAGNVLDRQFTADRPNQKWAADFIYVWTAKGWLYVAAVIDLSLRRVVGWSMGSSMTVQLVTDALITAIWRRGKPDALLHHSDQGIQGGFNRSSQQQEVGGCEDGGSKSIGAAHPSEATFTRASICVVARASLLLLAAHRPRACERGCCCGCWHLDTGLPRPHRLRTPSWGCLNKPVSLSTKPAAAHRPVHPVDRSGCRDGWRNACGPEARLRLAAVAGSDRP